MFNWNYCKLDILYMFRLYKIKWIDLTLRRPLPSPNNIHGGGSALEEVCGVLNGRDIAEDALPDVLW